MKKLVVSLSALMALTAPALAYSSPLAEAQMLEKSGKIEAAASVYHRILKADPNSVEASAALGRYYTKKGDYTKAQGYLQHLIDLDPKNKTAYMQRAALFQKKHNARQALYDYNQLLSYYPQFGPAYYQRGLLLIRHNQAAQGYQDLETATHYSPENYSAHYLLLEHHLATGHAMQVMLPHLNALIESPHAKPEYLFLRGRHFFQAQQMDAAFSDLNAGLKQKNNATARYLRSEIFFSRKACKAYARDAYLACIGGVKAACAYKKCMTPEEAKKQAEEASSGATNSAGSAVSTGDTMSADATTAQ